MTRVVLLTSGELRHRFLRMALALHDQVEVLHTYCEEPTRSLAADMARDDVNTTEREPLPL